MKSKYNAKKTTINGITFDSKAEARRYQELKLLERAGEISNLELQPKFTLIDKFKTSRGKSIRALTYTSDFKYREGKEIIIEDVKGHETLHFKIKMKVFLSKYSQYVFRISKAHRSTFKILDY